jgi:hypothetical protein
MIGRLDGRSRNRPPKQYQFKKGQSGYRKSNKQPKQLSAKRLFRKIVSEKVQVTIDNDQVEMSRFTACCRSIQQKALGGHAGAMKLYEHIRSAYGAASEREPLTIILANERETEI